MNGRPQGARPFETSAHAPLSAGRTIKSVVDMWRRDVPTNPILSQEHPAQTGWESLGWGTMRSRLVSSPCSCLASMTRTLKTNVPYGVLIQSFVALWPGKHFLHFFLSNKRMQYPTQQGAAQCGPHRTYVSYWTWGPCAGCLWAMKPIQELRTDSSLESATHAGT